MTFTAPDRNKRYGLADLKPYCKTHSTWDSRQLLPLPNLERLMPIKALNRLASGCEHIVVCLPDGHHTNWGAIWYHGRLDSNWDGSGLVTIPRYGTGSQPYSASFALCKHKDQYLPYANPTRGLHYKFCTLCGLDTSYDSSG